MRTVTAALTTARMITTVAIGVAAMMIIVATGITTGGAEFSTGRIKQQTKAFESLVRGDADKAFCFGSRETWKGSGWRFSEDYGQYHLRQRMGQRSLLIPPANAGGTDLIFSTSVICVICGQLLKQLIQIKLRDKILWSPTRADLIEQQAFGRTK